MSEFSRGALVGCLIGLAWSVLVLLCVYLIDEPRGSEHQAAEFTDAEYWRYTDESDGPGVVRVPCEEIQ